MATLHGITLIFSLWAFNKPIGVLPLFFLECLIHGAGIEIVLCRVCFFNGVYFFNILYRESRVTGVAAVPVASQRRASLVRFRQ